MLAQRDATGFPSPSECVYESVVENPSPPASIALCSSATISAISASVASRSTASLPITYRRSAQCPTSHPAFTPTLPSSLLRYSAKVSQFQGTPCSSAANGMPSTCAIIRRR